MNRPQRRWLISEFRGSLWSSRYRVQSSGSDDGDDDDAKFHTSTVNAARTLANDVYTLLFALKERAAKSTNNELYALCQSIQSTLWALEEFARGTTFRSSLVSARATCLPKSAAVSAMVSNKEEEWFEVQASVAKATKTAAPAAAAAAAASAAAVSEPIDHGWYDPVAEMEKDALDTRVAKVEAAASVVNTPPPPPPPLPPQAPKTETAVAPDYVVTSREVIHFGGPYWEQIPSYHVWLASLDVHQDAIRVVLCRLYDEYFEHECTRNISPVIVLSCKRLLRIAVERYCAVLPKLSQATKNWRANESVRRANKTIERASSSEMQRVMHARAFWDTINSCCFVDGQVLFDSGILPDICERHVIPALLACRAMVSKSGHRKYRVTPKQTGVLNSKIFEFVDTDGHCAAVDPSVLCGELASRADLPAALHVAVTDAAVLLRVKDWASCAVLIHNSTDVKERLYPAASSADAPSKHKRKDGSGSSSSSASGSDDDNDKKDHGGGGGKVKQQQQHGASV